MVARPVHYRSVPTDRQDEQPGRPSSGPRSIARRDIRPGHTIGSLTMVSLHVFQPPALVSVRHYELAGPYPFFVLEHSVFAVTSELFSIYPFENCFIFGGGAGVRGRVSRGHRGQGLIGSWVPATKKKITPAAKTHQVAAAVWLGALSRPRQSRPCPGNYWPSLATAYTRGR
jgi:hypothetical protein